jgi:hypothetical protein
MQNITMAKSTELPGMTGKGVAPVSIPEVDALVDDYVKKRDARMERTKLEVEAKDKLITSLRYHAAKIGADADGAITYRHDDLIVTLKHGKDDLKVRTEGGEENGD